MEEFGHFYERDEVEIISGIPSGIIRKGLLFFLLIIVLLISLSSLIKVNRNIQVLTKITSSKPVDIQVKQFGSDQNSYSKLKQDSNINFYKTTGDKTTIVKRDFKTMLDSVYSIPPNTDVKLFISINNSQSEKRFLIGQNLNINYSRLGYLLKTHVINIYLTTDNTPVYELEVNKMPQAIKYKFLCFSEYIYKGEINDSKTTMLQQIYSNLFNKIKI